jgi:hypothetical protein
MRSLLLVVTVRVTPSSAPFFVAGGLPLASVTKSVECGVALFATATTQPHEKTDCVPGL